MSLQERILERFQERTAEMGFMQPLSLREGMIINIAIEEFEKELDGRLAQERKQAGGLRLTIEDVEKML